jgi:hypothetical protein
VALLVTLMVLVTTRLGRMYAGRGSNSKGAGLWGSQRLCFRPPHVPPQCVPLTHVGLSRLRNI